jgi:hypothetical protein
MDSKEAIILVPGIRPAQQDEQLDVLIGGLRKSAESVRVSETSVASIDGMKGKRVTCTVRATGETKTIDFYECYLSDLVPRLSERRALPKLWEGTQILFFWAFSGLWKSLRAEPYLVLSAIVSSGVFLLWYFSVLALGLTALGEMKLEENSGLLLQAVKLASFLGAALGNWGLWLGLTTLLGLVRADRLADIGYFTRSYLGSDLFRGTIRSRVRDPLDRLTTSEQYSRVTVLAHSFGALVATDALAQFKYRAGPALGVITLGAPTVVLRNMAEWVPRELLTCARNSQIQFWLDFSSKSDWMGSQMDFGEKPTFPFVSARLRGMGGFLDQFTGGAHRAYFSRQEVVECLIADDPLAALVAQPPALAAPL